MYIDHKHPFRKPTRDIDLTLKGSLLLMGQSESPPSRINNEKKCKLRGSRSIPETIGKVCELSGVVRIRFHPLLSLGWRFVNHQINHLDEIDCALRHLSCHQQQCIYRNCIQGVLEDISRCYLVTLGEKMQLFHPNSFYWRTLSLSGILSLYSKLVTPTHYRHIKQRTALPLSSVAWTLNNCLFQLPSYSSP